MDYFLPSINQSNMPASNYIAGIQNNNVSPENAASQFTSVFLQNMLREIFKKESKNEAFSQMFADQMINELAENDAFGINKIVESSIGENHAGKSK